MMQRRQHIPVNHKERMRMQRIHNHHIDNRECKCETSSSMYDPDVLSEQIAEKITAINAERNAKIKRLIASEIKDSKKSNQNILESVKRNRLSIFLFVVILMAMGPVGFMFDEQIGIFMMTFLVLETINIVIDNIEIKIEDSNPRKPTIVGRLNIVKLILLMIISYIILLHTFYLK